MSEPLFQLPDFLRLAWASDAAREVWKPRFEAIRNVWPRVAVARVAGRDSLCVLLTLPSRMIFPLQAEARRRGLQALALGIRGVAVPGYAKDASFPQPGKPFLYDVSIGTRETCSAMQGLWERQDYAAAHRFAGYPQCCVQVLAEDIAARRLDFVGRYAGGSRNVKFAADSLVDPLWTWLRIGPPACAPCSLTCEAAWAQRHASITAAADSGYAVEMDWLQEVFSWPAEWSALHGIAELKTPILKAAWTTDVTYEKVALAYLGKVYPREGATGLRFPYQPPRRATLTASKAFQRGLENLITITPATPS
jgi:hypothetical protein